MIKRREPSIFRRARHAEESRRAQHPTGSSWLGRSTAYVKFGQWKTQNRSAARATGRLKRESPGLWHEGLGAPAWSFSLAAFFSGERHLPRELGRSGDGSPPRRRRYASVPIVPP